MTNLYTITVIFDLLLFVVCAVCLIVVETFLVAVDFIVQCLDEGKAVCASFLDFHRTFDSLDHNILLDTLFQLNMDPAVLKWFQNDLSDRWHRVRV